LTKNLDKTLQLLEKRLLNPKFDQEALGINKKRLIENLKNSSSRPNYIASTVYPKLLFGANNVIGWSSIGTDKTINKIELSDIENYYKNYFSKKDAQIIIVGDVEKSNITSKLAFLNKLEDKEVKLPEIPSGATLNKSTINFVNVPNAAQTEFRIGFANNLKYDATGNYFKAGVMNYPLGGAFNSRLNLDLREDKGWTYGARGNFEGDKYSGIYTFSAGIRADATDSALIDILKIFADFKKGGVTAEELAFTKSSLGQSDARKYEALMQKAGFLSRIQEYNLPDDYTKQQNDILSNLTLKEVNELVEKFAPNNNQLNILLVGDKAKVFDRLNAFGFEVVELDKEGNPVK